MFIHINTFYMYTHVCTHMYTSIHMRIKMCMQWLSYVYLVCIQNTRVNIIINKPEGGAQGVINTFMSVICNL